MAEYIEREALLAEAKRISGPMTGDGWDNWGVYSLINRQPAADVVEVVRCRECKYWKDIHVLQNDGRERQYTKEEYDGDDFILFSPCVSSNVGINVGSKCMYDDQCGYSVDKTVFRGADDYCSKGEKRPCSYEKWWGIEDGYYPAQE